MSSPQAAVMGSLQRKEPTAAERFTMGAAALLAAATIHFQWPVITPPGTMLALLCLLLMTGLLWEHLAPTRQARLGITLAACLLTLMSHTPVLAALSPALLLTSCAYFDRSQHRTGITGVLLALAFFQAFIMVECSGLLWQDLSHASWTISFRLTRSFTGIGQPVGFFQNHGDWLLFAGCLWLARIVNSPRLHLAHIRWLLLVVVGGISAIATQQGLFALAAHHLFSTAVCQAN